MKKSLLPFLALLFLISCEKESTMELVSEENISENGSLTTRSPAPKIDVCHYDEEDGTWVVINISENAWPAHANHGDVQLIDNDGDGWVASANGCNIPVDCDDNDPLITDCCPAVEIESNGPLFVALEDEPGTYTLQEAIAACSAKGLADGCDWYLPSKEELNDLHINRNVIGGFNEGVYWSATPVNGTHSWAQHFNTIYNGTPVPVTPNVPGPCRCVRR